jgi:hypothetical protein
MVSPASATMSAAVWVWRAARSSRCSTSPGPMKPTKATAIAHGPALATACGMM